MKYNRPSDLIEQYNNFDRLIDLANHYNVSVDTARRWLKIYDLDFKHNKVEIFDVELFKKLHYEQCLPLNYIAKEMGMTVKTLSKAMNRNNLVSNHNKKSQLFNKDILQSLHINNQFTLSEISRQFNVSDVFVGNKCREFGIDTIHYPQNGKSKTEIDILNFVQQFDPDAKKFYFDQTEFDISSRKHKVLIEFCGLFWHSERYKNNQYHLNKLKIAKKYGYKLLTIFEDEWLERKEIVKSIILSKLGIFERRLFARTLIVGEIETTSARKFLKENHLQGDTPNIQTAIGLFTKKNELIGCMTIGKHHRNSKELVLNRLAFSKNTQIVGGSSKCLQFFLRNYEWERLISWSDNRWSDGSIYEILGFSKENELPPDYSYTNGQQKRVSKQSMKKSRTGCPKEMTEKEWNLANGWNRIWDCGKIRWIIHNAK